MDEHKTRTRQGGGQVEGPRRDEPIWTNERASFASGDRPPESGSDWPAEPHGTKRNTSSGSAGRGWEHG